MSKTKVAKITLGVVGAITALAMAGGVAVLPAFAADDVAAQIAALMAQIQLLQAKLAAQPSATVAGSYTFSTNLTVGSKGTDVMHLQQVLNSAADTMVAASGAGSIGNETTYFGPATKAAVMKFQTKYGISPVAGYVGAITRAKLNSLSVATTPVTPGTPVTPTTPAAAGTLVVTAASAQPANQLAPLGATRIPFTKFTVTAGATDVPLTSVTVERTGSSVDAALESIVLLDESGTQLGISKTLNSVHRVTVGDPITVKAFTSRTFTIGANRPSTAVANTSGTLISLDLVAVNTTAAVAGDTLPIRGALNTINDTLTIGTITMQRGSIDPGSDQSKEIGTISYTFSSVKVSAGSAESLTLRSVRWNQVGSAGVADLANLKTFVDGVAYDAVTTDGGKFYTSTFGNGILIDKGFSKDISIKGDIVGGSSRTIRFDVAKRTDINLVGNIYNYGILPPQTGAVTSASLGTSGISGFTSSEDPWYRGATVTMSNGTMTVSSDSSIAAQNIAVNLANQPLGGWSVDVRGEPISIAKMVFNLQANIDTAAHITNIILTDANGAILAGPADGSGTAPSGTVTFTDSVTLPVGITKLVLKGKLSTDFITNDNVAASTTPGTDWTTVRGQVTGNTITPSPSSALTGSTMTVKAGALAITESSQPVAQTVIAGANQFEFAKYVLDAGQSGEDVRVTSFAPKLTVTTVTATNLSSCQLWDGATSVTTGSNVKNPTAAGDQTFTFDGTGLLISKGTSKTLSLKCNVASGVTGSVVWGLTDNSDTFTGATGVTSGQTVAETMPAANGQTMTLSDKGSYTVAKDSSSAYQYRAVKAGTDVLLGALKFSAGVTEDVTIKQVALVIGNTASSSASDLVNQYVTLWDGSTQVGTAQFGGIDTNNATSSLNLAPFVITKGNTKTLVIKGTLSAQDSVNGTPGAFLAINYDGNNNGQNGNYATGNASGATISGTSATVATDGVRIFRNIPTFAVTSANGTLVAGGGLYKFTVTNPDSQRDILLKQVKFNIATTGSSVTGFTLYGDGIAANSSVIEAAGADTAETLTMVFDSTSAAKVVPAGSSKTYELKAATVTVVTAAPATDYLNITMLADTAFQASAYLLDTVASTTVGSKIVWSPQSTTTQSTAGEAVFEYYKDWTNGYGLPGFVLGQNFPTQSWSRGR